METTKNKLLFMAIIIHHNGPSKDFYKEDLMKITKITKLASFCIVALSLFNCSKPPPPVVEAPAPPPPVVEVEKPAPPPEIAPVVEAPAPVIEEKRKNIQDIINSIVSNEVYFEFDQSSLTEQARDILAKVGEILMSEKSLFVVIEGYTDERGTESYNLALGARRASSVKDYLIQYGVPSTRFSTVSFGEEKAKVEGEGEQAWAQNRRSAFKVEVR